MTKKPDATSKKKKKPASRLGRGLGSLIKTPVAIKVGPLDSDAAPIHEQSSSAGLSNLPLSSIATNSRQPRQRFDEVSLGRLAASIKESGLMQPIVVRPTAGGYELIAGERRLRACAQLGFTSIPAVIRDADDRDAASWALVENIQREDLSPLERADGIYRLMDEFSLTQAEAGERVALDRATIANLLRLRELDPSTREALAEGLLSQGHARALLGCKDVDVRVLLLARCVRDGWSVRETERRVKRAHNGTAIGGGATVPRSANVEDLEVRLGAHLGTKVRISLGRKKGTGRMTIQFFSLDQFDGLLAKVGFNADE